MAENDWQYQAIVEARFALEHYYRADPQAYVSGDLFVYFSEEDPYLKINPDILVSLGIAKEFRHSYKIWTEGKAPDVVFEIVAASTWKSALSWKRELYEWLGIAEYFVFDPSGQYISPILQGYVQTGHGHQRPVTPLNGDKGTRGLPSAVLGLELWAQCIDETAKSYTLRFWDPSENNWLVTPTDLATLEQELAQLRAEVARLRGEAFSKCHAERSEASRFGVY